MCFGQLLDGFQLQNDDVIYDDISDKFSHILAVIEYANSLLGFDQKASL
jgi:hypothetical protein